jgi:hypothetical protein
MTEARTPEIAHWCSVLGVSPSATRTVIKAAGKALLTDAHPDKATDENERISRTRQAQEITEAVAALCDPLNAPLTKAAPPPPQAHTQTQRPAPGPFPFAHRAAVTRRPTVADLAQHLEFDLVVLLFLANRNGNGQAPVTALTELTPLLEKNITSSVKKWIEQNKPVSH